MTIERTLELLVRSMTTAEAQHGCEDQDHCGWCIWRQEYRDLITEDFAKAMKSTPTPPLPGEKEGSAP